VWTAESLEDIFFLEAICLFVLGNGSVGLELRDDICLLLRI